MFPSEVTHPTYIAHVHNKKLAVKYINLSAFDEVINSTVLPELKICLQFDFSSFACTIVNTDIFQWFLKPYIPGKLPGGSYPLGVNTLSFVDEKSLHKSLTKWTSDLRLLARIKECT